MDLAKVLQELYQELENLNAAISSLERLEEAAKHRGKDRELLGQVAIPARAVRKRKANSKGDSGAGEQEPGAGGQGPRAEG